jgi:nucleoside-diphosphate-sugar epimerase
VAHGIAIDVGSEKLVTIRELAKHIAKLVGASEKPLFGALPDRPLEQTKIADVTRRHLFNRPSSFPLSRGGGSQDRTLA